MTVSLKPGAQFAVLNPQLLFGIFVAALVHEAYGLDLVITSGTDGVHMDGSLHAAGRAVDVRRFEMEGRKLNDMLSMLRVSLGPDYDVVLEKDHIHMEYDPKEKAR